jgi:hypothetical protein
MASSDTRQVAGMCTDTTVAPVALDTKAAIFFTDLEQGMCVLHVAFTRACASDQREPDSPVGDVQQQHGVLGGERDASKRRVESGMERGVQGGGIDPSM